SRTENEVAPGTKRDAAAPRVRLPAVARTSPVVAVTPPAVATKPARAVTRPALETSRLSLALAVSRIDIEVAPGMMLEVAAVSVIGPARDNAAPGRDSAPVTVKPPLMVAPAVALKAPDTVSAPVM